MRPTKRSASAAGLIVYYCEPDNATSDGIFSPAASKRARVHDADSVSEFAASTAPTFAMSTALTLPDTETPLTESSVSRNRNNKPRAKRFECSWPGCGKAFDRPIRLQVHYNTHTGDRPHACPHAGCEKAFFKSSHLKAHILEKHNEERGHVCAFQVYNEAGELASCGRAFPTSTKLKRHVAQHEEKEETTCDWHGCGRVFRKQETLQRHIKKDHLHEMPYLCTQETHDGGACGQSFPTQGLLKAHAEREHSAKLYVCEICSSAPQTTTVAAGVPSNDLDEAFLPTAEDLTSSGLTPEHGRQLATNEQGLDGRMDITSSSEFATFAELQLHIRLLHPPTCTACGKECKSNKDLKAHIDIYHAPPTVAPKGVVDQEFLCPSENCPRSCPGNGFTRKGNMDVHIKNVHAKEKAFICGEHDLGENDRIIGWNRVGCHLALGTRQALIAHIRTQHLGLDAATGVRTGLQKSAMSRKGRPRKECNTTSVQYTPMEVDTVHDRPHVDTALTMLTGAGYEVARPIPCLLAGPGRCQMRFTREWDLATHLELTHGWQVDDIEEALSHGAIPLAALGTAETHADSAVHMLDRGMQGIEDSGFIPVVDPQLQSSTVWTS